MNALILGGSGRLGTALLKLLPSATAPSHADFDLTDILGFQPRLVAARPSVIINCAAYTAVDAAEEDEAKATLINGEAVGELAAVADRSGIPFVTFSTDYVFDGTIDTVYTESAVPAPLNAYGRSKRVGEQMALDYPGSLVIRTSWLLSSTHTSFVSTVLGRAAKGEVRVVTDQWGRPTMVDDLAVATIAAIESGVTGLLHLASPPTTTWFALAQDACRFVGLDPKRVRPIASDRLNRRAERPRHAVLGSDRGFVLPEWRPALEAWLRRDAPLIGPDSHPAARAEPV